MLNPIEIKNRLIHMGEAVKAEVFYDMQFRTNFYDFFSLTFQAEVQFQDFFKRYSK